MSILRNFILRCTAANNKGCYHLFCGSCMGFDLRFELIECVLHDLGLLTIADKHSNYIFEGHSWKVERHKFFEKDVSAFPKEIEDKILEYTFYNLNKVTFLGEFDLDEIHVVRQIIIYLQRSNKVTDPWIDERIFRSDVATVWRDMKEYNARKRTEANRQRELRESITERRAEKKKIAQAKHEWRKEQSAKRKPFFKKLKHINKSDYLRCKKKYMRT